MKVRWHCSRCGKRGTTRIESRMHFHPCAASPQPPPRRRAELGDGFAETMEERRQAMFAAIALGGDPSTLRMRAPAKREKR